MNRKKIIISIISLIVLVSLVLAGAVFLTGEETTTVSNSSRRDGKTVEGAGQEDDLLLVSGEAAEEKSVSEEDILKAKEREESDSALLSLLETADATAPSVSEVESVSVLILPEAIVMEEGDREEFYANEDFAEIVPVDRDTFSFDEIPSKYDSRDVEGKRYVTEVENQGYSYLCWAYAALGAVEGDILANNPDISYEDIDYSEKHFAYYNMHQTEGSYGGYIDDDYREFVNADNSDGDWIFEYDTNYIAMGGVTDFSISVLTAWKGPVTETGTDAFDSIFGEKYMFEDNSSIPSGAYKSEAHVQTVYEIQATLDNGSLIKEMIMKHGGVAAGVSAGDEFWSSGNKNLYSYYDGKEVPAADHEILIIGWDDDYDADNFKEKPPGNGAWLCKNSWGTSSGNKGYFYLSYYDETTNANNAAAYGVALVGDDDFYDHNYQAAGFLTYVVSSLQDDENYVTSYSKSSNPYGIMYSARSDEELKAIGIMGLETYQQYDISIYINPKVEGMTDYSAIEIDELSEAVTTFKVAAISGGYHTFELEEPLELAAGDEFFVVIDPVTKGRLAFENQADNISKPNYDEWNNLTGNIHNHYSASGCSYYISEDGTAFIRQQDKDFFVKAYTNDR